MSMRVLWYKNSDEEICSRGMSSCRNVIDNIQSEMSFMIVPLLNQSPLVVLLKA